MTGTEAEVEHAFERAYRVLRLRIERFLALPLDTLERDPPELGRTLVHIGTLLP